MLEENAEASQTQLFDDKHIHGLMPVSQRFADAVASIHASNAPEEDGSLELFPRTSDSLEKLCGHLQIMEEDSIHGAHTMRPVGIPDHFHPVGLPRIRDSYVPYKIKQAYCKLTGQYCVAAKVLRAMEDHIFLKESILARCPSKIPYATMEVQKDGSITIKTGGN